MLEIDHYVVLFCSLPILQESEVASRLHWSSPQSATHHHPRATVSSTFTSRSSSSYHRHSQVDRPASIMKVLSACLLGYLGTACAWSFAGHELIAHVASDLLSADARHRIHSILGGSHLSTIATWADSITWLPQYKYSSVLHYYNAPHDDPPHDCGLRWTQPGGQDVIAAIHNYTSILKTAEDGSWAQSEALRFLVHFLQDMHQPLHRMSVLPLM